LRREEAPAVNPVERRVLDREVSQNERSVGGSEGGLRLERAVRDGERAAENELTAVGPRDRPLQPLTRPRPLDVDRLLDAVARGARTRIAADVRDAYWEARRDEPEVLESRAEVHSAREGRDVLVVRRYSDGVDAVLSRHDLVGQVVSELTAALRPV